MEIDLEALSLKDLKELRGRIERAISTFEDRRRSEAIAQLEEMARAKGFSLSELTAYAKPRKRGGGMARYANPANPGDTWTGRGRKPRWFSEAIAGGTKPEELAV